MLLSLQVQAKSKFQRHKERATELAPAPWRLHERQPHWLLASRPFPQHGQKEYFAELNVKAPPQAIFALLQDSQRVPEWVHHAQSAKVLTHLAPGHFTVESRFTPPWPIRNRDLISESHQWQRGQELWLEIHATPYAKPKQAGYVRIQRMQSCWLARPEADGSSTLFHLGHMQDPGYSPDLLINTAMTLSLSSTLENLMQILPEYQSSQLFIQHSSLPTDWNYCNTLADILTLPWPQLEPYTD